MFDASILLNIQTIQNQTFQNQTTPLQDSVGYKTVNVISKEEFDKMFAKDAEEFEEPATEPPPPPPSAGMWQSLVSLRVIFSFFSLA